MMDTHEIINLIQDKFGKVMFTFASSNLIEFRYGVHVYSVRGESGLPLSVMESVGSSLGDDYQITQFSRLVEVVLQGWKRDESGSVCDSETTN